MNNIIKQQLNMLKSLDFEVDGESVSDFPDSFSEVVFKRNIDSNLNDNRELTIQFMEYVLDSFMDDFHKKFNNGDKPSELVMYGTIIRETDKMNYIMVHNKDNTKTFKGWIPKKSMKIL